jgi:hypothetical protein
LKGGELGKLLVAEARTIDPKIGRNGSGLLFEVNFKVKVESPTGATVSFAAGSFCFCTLFNCCLILFTLAYLYLYPYNLKM